MLLSPLPHWDRAGASPPATVRATVLGYALSLLVYAAVPGAGAATPAVLLSSHIAPHTTIAPLPLKNFFNIYLFRLCQVLVAVCGIFSCGIWALVSDQESNLGPLY